MSVTVLTTGDQDVFDGIKLTKEIPLDNRLSDLRFRLRQIVNWFKNDTIDFATLYLIEPDLFGHG